MLDQSKLLRFTHGNAKLPDSVMIFSLPTGHTCPGAQSCLSKANRESGKLQDGKNISFRCYAATQEAAFPTVRRARWHNFDLLKPRAASAPAMARLIHDSLEAAVKRRTRHVRIHGAGDFFSQRYFDAWLQVAQDRPMLEFYAYTKSLPFWVDWQVTRGQPLPENVNFVASRGGKHDHLIDAHQLPEVVVVNHPDVAAAMGLEIDHDDTHVQQGVPKFALLLHAQQPVGSQAAADLAQMREEGIDYGYRH